MPEAETVLQPSLYNLHDGEWCARILNEVEDRGLSVKKLRKEYHDALAIKEDFATSDRLEAFAEIEQEAIEMIEAAGYPVWDEDDTFLIYPKGSELPE